MADDGLCHICRRPPVGQSPLFDLTTCADCMETDRLANSTVDSIALVVAVATVLFTVAGIVSAIVIWVAT